MKRRGNEQRKRLRSYVAIRPPLKRKDEKLAERPHRKQLKAPQDEADPAAPLMLLHNHHGRRASRCVAGSCAGAALC